MSFQGIEFTPEMRKLVVNVKQFFTLNKKNQELFDAKSAISLTALAMGISESSVGKITAAFNKGGDDILSWSNAENRGRPPYTVEAGLETTVRQLVRNANRNGEQVTVDIIKKFLLDNFNCEVPYATLWRTLTRWGFEFGTGTRSARLKESSRIIIQRRQYLRAKINNRRMDGSIIRPEIYLDESYINKNHSRDASWFIEENDCIVGKPTGKGERLIIVNAINREGWIPNAKLVFASSKKTTDYHTSMNWKAFSEWFENKLLPNIPENSIIIMDNAQYHNVLSAETFPQKKHTLFHLRYWLSNNKIPWKEDMLKEELYDLCKRFSPKPEFALDKMASKRGHTILRTPPYHPELQPIETCWAVVKSHVAKYNNFKMEKVKELLSEGFDKVNSHTIKGIIQKVQKVEDDFWVEDSRSGNQEEEQILVEQHECELADFDDEN
jgi:transposase